MRVARDSNEGRGKRQDVTKDEKDNGKGKKKKNAKQVTKAKPKTNHRYKL